MLKKSPNLSLEDRGHAAPGTGHAQDVGGFNRRSSIANFSAHRLSFGGFLNILNTASLNRRLRKLADAGSMEK